jgi:hypothetical protein
MMTALVIASTSVVLTSVICAIVLGRRVSLGLTIEGPPEDRPTKTSPMRANRAYANCRTNAPRYIGHAKCGRSQ